jgi:hypothetical protein
LGFENIDEIPKAGHLPLRYSESTSLKLLSPSAKSKPWKCRGMESMEAMEPAFHPSHTPWKSLRRFPHYHGYGDDYHVFEDRQSPPKTRNQSHFRRKGL